jgi:hypothetical protein
MTAPGVSRDRLLIALGETAPGGPGGGQWAYGVD